MKKSIFFDKRNIRKSGSWGNEIFAYEVFGKLHKKLPQPRKPEHNVSILIIEGSFSGMINGKKIKARKNTFLNLPVWTDIYEINFSENFQGLATAIHSNIIRDIFRNRNPFPPAFRFRFHTYNEGISLSKSDTNRLAKDIANLIDSLKRTNHNYSGEVNYAYFYIMLTDLADIIWKKTEEAGQPEHNVNLSRPESIIRDFVNLLSENVEKETSIGFYADTLCISKQYLSLVVKQKTQRSIGQVIATLRVEKASKLLRDPDLTIQQIADKLSFADQSTFGKFFKRHTGVSPLQYRNNLKKSLLSMRTKDFLN